jgi:hypothetical protein
VFLLWITLFATLMAKSWDLPEYHQPLVVHVIWIIAVAMLVLAAGWVAVFYKLHAVIFPHNHQCFFYYHEALMWTMINSPDLFLYIGLSPQRH